MAAEVPAALKAAEIGRFASRAAQVEKAKPPIAFWSYYWIAQQIITKGLQNNDDDCRTYTAGVMDKLEAAKAERPDDDAITDDIAGKAYVEQFGLDIFQRADNAVRANKASRQTADTFLAAATFLELLQIWPPLDGEITAKVKFAKYHAARILKAIKAGEDPNLSNPTPEPASSPEGGQLPSIDRLHQEPRPGFQQPSGEEIPDEQHRLEPSLARTSSLDQSLHPSRAPSLPRPPPVDVSASAASGAAETFYQGAANGEVSPLGPPSTGPALSEGGGYFPSAPAPSVANPPVLPPPPSNNAGGSGAAQGQPSPFYPPPAVVPQPPQFSPQNVGQGAPVPSNYPPSHNPYATSFQHPPQASPPVTSPATVQPQPPPSGEVGEEAIAKAQKHARWAISALNFDDVPTAVNELRGALQTLGAR